MEGPVAITAHFHAQQPPARGQARGFKGATVETDSKAD